MFGRATITLGIGPQSSLCFIFGPFFLQAVSFFTACRNTRITSAVLAMAILSVCLSVCDLVLLQSCSELEFGLSRTI